MSSLLEPYKKPRPLRLPPYFYLLLAIALISIPRPLIHFPTTTHTMHTTTPTLHLLPNATIPDESAHSIIIPDSNFTFLNSTTAEVKECDHIVLVSAARHGSTWLIDSVEGCHSVNGSYGRMNRFAELWNTGQFGPLRDMLPFEAAEYALRNHSIKIFPPALTSHGKAGLFALFAAVKQIDLPVFVLRRRLEDSYDSLVVAKETKLWNSEKVVVEDAGERRIIKDEKWTAYQTRMEEYFDDVTGVMKEAGVRWDEIRYEDAISQMRIVGDGNRCYIRNCNFRRR